MLRGSLEVIRFADPSERDIEHICDIASKVYGDVYAHPEATRSYIKAILKNPSMLLLIGEKAFGCACISSVFWKPEPIAYQLFLAALPNNGFEGIRICEQLMFWAKKKGAATFILSSDMKDEAGEPLDFSLIAKRLKMEYNVLKMTEVIL